MYEDLYDTETVLTHHGVKKINENCGHVQNRILELFKNSTPENMNFLINEVENYKMCLKNI